MFIEMMAYACNKVLQGGYYEVHCPFWKPFLTLDKTIGSDFLKNGYTTHPHP
jgi:hypothetical protein